MHEHLDDFALINMNGRCYDPMLARFLSPDPYIQSPDDALNYNRFAYCMNNPFLFTDPSGEFFFKKLFQFLGAVLGVATAIVETPLWIVKGFDGNPIQSGVNPAVARLYRVIKR